MVIINMVKMKRKLLMGLSENVWESRAVLNPSVVVEKGVEHIFYRAVSKDWISSIGYARIVDGELERFNKPILEPTEDYEIKGIEDPRITKIGNIYYILYTAFDGRDARIAYAVSKNLVDWKKMGIISPGIPVNEARKLVKIKKYRDKWANQEVEGSRISLWDKDAVLLPEKINGKFIMLHRFMPDIQVLKFDKFEDLMNDDFWRNYIRDLSEGEDKVSLYRRYHWEGEHIGAGAVPIKTKKGWLLIYHGVELVGKESMGYHFHRWFNDFTRHVPKFRRKRLPLIYHAGAALLDLKKPEEEISRLSSPLFSPKYDWEKEGDINDVVFPEGCSVDGDKLKIYYGCSDSRIGVAEMSLRELLAELGRAKSD